jgi:hypothetical protein
VCVLREREEKRHLEGKWQNLLNLEECGSVRGRSLRAAAVLLLLLQSVIWEILYI